LAIHDESLTQALQETPPCMLWTEAASGKYDIIACAPKRVPTKNFKELLETTTFQDQLGFCVVDEAHLILPWGNGFWESYKVLGRLCSLLPSYITFLAMSGSMHPKTVRPKTQELLGFVPPHFEDVSLPIDWTDLIYCPHTLKHPITGTEFPNLAWLIPDMLASPDDIPCTLIAVRTIAIAQNLAKWLNQQLGRFGMSPKAYPFHSIIPQEEQIQTLANLESGLVQIVVATTAGQVGLDMAVRDVIILDLPSDFEAITQWNGCASWDGQGGHAIIYAPDAIHIENVADLDGDPVAGK